MPAPSNHLTLGTRGSALALAQAHHVRDLLRAKWPRLDIEIKIIKTQGDAFQNLSLTRGRGKGLFTREIEQALLRNQIDVAVHSLKDLPTTLPAGLALAAIPQRADPRDVLIAKELPSENELPRGAQIATSSLRRKAQLLALRPDLVVEEIRGNIETRIRKLVESETLSALILAAAGLERLGAKIAKGKLTANFLDAPLAARKLSVEEMLPAVGQAALGLETRANDERALSFLAQLNHYASAQAVVSERAFLAALGGGCRVPIAAWAEVREGELRLRGAVFAADGRQNIVGSVAGHPDEAESLGARLAEELKSRGAERLLK